MTKNVSMVLANRDAGACFRYMKFLPLDEHHAILCIVTDDGNVANCVVEIPLGMRPEELDYMAGRVSRLLEGRALANITEDLLQACLLYTSPSPM